MLLVGDPYGGFCGLLRCFDLCLRSYPSGLRRGRHGVLSGVCGGLGWKRGFFLLGRRWELGNALHELGHVGIVPPALLGARLALLLQHPLEVAHPVAQLLGQRVNYSVSGSTCRR